MIRRYLSALAAFIRKIDRVYLLFYLLVFFLCLGCLIIGRTLRPYTVVGNSMSPAFKDGTIVSCQKPSEYDLKTGDVIVCRNPESNRRIVKRIIAVPGDTVQIINGVLYRNGKQEETGFPSMEDAGLASEPLTVPHHSYFVLGDNRNESLDSRKFGCVPYRLIEGVVTRILISH